MADHVRRPEIVLVTRCFVKRGDNQLLLIKRALADNHNAGQWEVPGGKLEKGQDLTQAQEREVLEETGLLIEPFRQMGTFESFLIPDGKYKDLTYVALFGVTNLIGGRLRLSSEHCDAKWLRYEEMFDLDLTFEVRKAAINLEKDLKTKTPAL